MSQQACSNCPTLVQIIQKQQAEIGKLKKVIADARLECLQLEAETRKVMSGHGSPYKYKEAQGARDAAERVKRQLKV